jgi:1-aminocyclopropane-1-carboxylate deaminase/D-cysteine desulfhydrase-like pyridoxal-dependent ACC family enzyme
VKFTLGHSPIQKINEPLFTEKEVFVFIKRDDLIHAEIQGNKWRKLKYNLIEARFEEQKTLLTFGGIYSNHIFAVAAAGKYFGFKTIGIIRGEPADTPTETLKFAAQCGMKILFMDRTHYREKDQPENIESLKQQLGDFYHIPEGGTNLLALPGCAEMVQEIKQEYHYICSAVGTGGTLAGILSAIDESKKAIGFSSLKGKDTLTDSVRKLAEEFSGKPIQNFHINFDYHFGGYAKVNETLIQFIKDFKRNHHIQLEPVYTGKMMYGIYDLIQKDFFPKGSNILAIHTGGLQGFCGYKDLLD